MVKILLGGNYIDCPNCADGKLIPSKIQEEKGETEIIWKCANCSSTF